MNDHWLKHLLEMLSTSKSIGYTPIVIVAQYHPVCFEKAWLGAKNGPLPMAASEDEDKSLLRDCSQAVSDRDLTVVDHFQHVSTTMNHY